MLQEPDVILGIKPQIVDAVLQLAYPFDTHPEGETRILFGVDAEIFQHFGMNHAAAEDLHPTGILADIATLAAADAAVDVHLGARLGEREIGRTEPHLHILSEHFLDKEINGLLQIGERNMLIHIQPFRLMEETVRAGADGLVPVNAAGTNDPDGRFLCFHHPRLHAARMRTQQPVGIAVNIEGILHVPRRMVLGQVEGGKIMPVVFDLGSLRYRKAQPSEDVDDLVANQRDGMMGAQRQHISGQTDIDLMGASGAIRAETAFPVFVGGFCELLELIEDLSERFFLLRGDIPHFIEHPFHDAFRAEEPYTIGLKRVRTVRYDGGYFLSVFLDLP